MLTVSACTGTLEGGAPDGFVNDGAAVVDRAVDSGGAPDQGLNLDRQISGPDQKPPKPDLKQSKPDAKAPKPDLKLKPDAPPVVPPLDLSKVKWLHTNVSGWAVKAKLSSVTFKGAQICLNYDKANVWGKKQINGTDVNANPWVFIWQGGLWYGATWEWMRPGQTCKNKSSVAGDHIKQKPFDAASGWKPKSGQVLYFMVSGLARSSSIQNVKERTAPVKVIWP